MIDLIVGPLCFFNAWQKTDPALIHFFSPNAMKKGQPERSGWPFQNNQKAAIIAQTEQRVFRG